MSTENEQGTSKWPKPTNDNLIESAVKATLQIFYDKGLFDSYDDADEVFKDYRALNGRPRGSKGPPEGFLWNHRPKQILTDLLQGLYTQKQFMI